MLTLLDKLPKKVKKGIVIGAVALSLFGLSACGSSSSSGNNDSSSETTDTTSDTTNTNDTIYSDDVQQISSEDGQRITSCGEAYGYSFIEFTSLPEELKENPPRDKILVYQGNSQATTGCAGKFMQFEGNRIYLKVASLEDIYEKANFSVKGSAGQNSFRPQKLANGIFDAPALSAYANTLVINNCFNNGKFCVSGSVGIDFDFELDGKIDSFRIQSLAFKSATKKSIDLKVSSTSSTYLKKDVEIATYYGTPFPTPSGIVFVPYFNVDLNASASTVGAIEFEAKGTEESTISLSYRRNSNPQWNFSKIKNTNFENRDIPEILMLKMEAKVGVEISSGVLVYGIAGAGIGGEFFTNLDVDPFGNPLASLKAGVDIGFELKAGVFGVGIEYNQSILSLEKILWKYSEEDVPINIILNASTTNGQSPLTVLFDVYGSSAENGIQNREYFCDANLLRQGTLLGGYPEEFMCTYNEEGEFTSRAIITDTQGYSKHKDLKIYVGRGETPSVEVEEYPGYIRDLRDGKEYTTEVFGTERWMTQNLDYRNGDYKCYNDSSSNCNDSGTLYSQNESLSACPAGWSLPSIDDWKYVATQLGFSPGTYGAVNSTIEKINKLFVGGASGMDIQKGGAYIGNWSKYLSQGTSGYYWLSTKGDYGVLTHLKFTEDYSSITVTEGFGNDYHSVRCKKD